MASPAVFLLRRVLEEASDFQSALRTLKEAPLASDSLLLLTGVRAGEMAVIERTPSRAEIRFGESASIFVTNDYRTMRTGWQKIESELQGIHRP
jgi:predicted choloylglycine hydrolase